MLFADDIIAERRYDDNSNDWDSSELKSWLNGATYKTNSDKFTTIEQGAIATNTDGDMRLLTIEEVKKPEYDFTDDETRAASSWWWLRSPGDSVDYAARVFDGGFVSSIGGDVYREFGSVRPTFNLNLDSVLFSSASSAGKSSFAKVGKNQVRANIWKLTLKDSSKTVSVTNGESVTQSGQNVTVPYTYTGNDVSQISIMITDKAYTESDASILYYGALNTTLATTGTGTFTLPAGLPDGYKIYMMAEDVNDGNLTDYSSEPVEITSVEVTTTPLTSTTYAVTVNNGTGDGSYAKGATVTITADEAPSGQEFDKWTVVSGGVTLASVTSATTTFTMPANAVEVTATYKNATVSIAQAEISGVSDKNYTGKTLTQSNLTLKIGNTTLKQNIDYTVSYSNNKNVGTATITIDGKGKYTGTMKKTFRITLSKGKTYTINSMKYKVTNADIKGNGTVTLIGTTKKKTDKKFTSLSIGSTVKIGGVSFKITAIGDNAFQGYTKIKKVTVGNNVATIGKSAFSGCSMITTVTLGTRVKSIGASAFYNCKKLSKLTIKSKKLSSVGSKAIINIKKNAIIDVPGSKVKDYKKLFKSSTGFKKTMKIK